MNGELDNGGIERVDPVQWRSDGFLARESVLGGDLVDFAQWSPTRDFAIIVLAGGNTALISFDPTTGERTGDLYNPGGYVLSDCEVLPSGWLLLADREIEHPGVRLFDAQSGAPSAADPITTGLPPFQFVRIDSLAAPTPAPASLLAPPYPNPARGAVQVRWEGGAGPPALQVFDCGGRLLRALAWSSSDPPIASWDGRDEKGHPVPSGVYRLRAAAPGHPTRSICLVR